MALVRSTSCAILLVATLWVVGAAPPTTKLASLTAQDKLKRLSAHITAYSKYMFNMWLSTCRVNDAMFTGNCSNVHADTCKQCSNNQYTTQATCTGNGSTWDSNAPNSQCCKDGNKECEYDASGNSLEFGCCNYCNENPNDWRCQWATFEGPSVCGTTAGTCHACTGFDPNQGWIPDSQSSCQNSGICSITCSGCTSQGGCTSKGICSVGNNPTDETTCINRGTSLTPATFTAASWTAATWTQNTSATTELLCKALDYCERCTLSQYSSQSACTSNGGTWGRVAATSEIMCRVLYGSNAQWRRVQKYTTGQELPATPMYNASGRSSCSTGPTHITHGRTETPGACLTAATFLADAEVAKPPAQARADNSAYYSKLLMLSRAIVTNAANAADRAHIGVEPAACFMVITQAKNKGEIVVNGGNSTHAIIHGTTNYADADAIVVTGGQTFTVLNTTNAGPIAISGTQKVEIQDVTNSGPITVTGVHDLFLSNVTNRAGANVTVYDAIATLMDIRNFGAVEVKGPQTGTTQGGHYRAWGVVNQGTVSIEAGTIEIDTVCPSSGTITISPGVTGTISYQSGCQGTISAPNTVTISQAASAAGTPSFFTATAAMTVPDADAFVADAVALNAVAAGFATAIGIPTSWVSATATKTVTIATAGGRRMEARNLAGTSVQVTYTVTIPASEPASTATTTLVAAQAVTPAQIASEVNSKLATAKGPGYQVSVTSASTGPLTMGAAQNSALMSHAICTLITPKVFALVTLISAMFM